VLAPSLAHAFSLYVRRCGRELFEHGAVRGATGSDQRLEGWVLDRGREFHATLALRPTVQNTHVEPTCSCPADQKRAMCRHVYALLLAIDAEELGDGAAPDPHDLEQMLAYRLRLADRQQEENPEKAAARDGLAKAVAGEVERIARRWRRDFHGEVPDGPLNVEAMFEEGHGDEPSAEARLRDMELARGEPVDESSHRLTRTHYFLESSGSAVFVRMRRSTLGKSGKWGKLAQFGRRDLERSRLTAEDQSILWALCGASPAHVWEPDLWEP
jgi:hypothetical protein